MKSKNFQDLTDEELQRYSRHILLPQVGGIGQLKLKNAKVIVIGTGGLGSAVLFYIAAAGIGEITVVDFDTVDLSNLQRQIIHSTKDLKKPKIKSASTKINALNPHIKLNLIQSRLDKTNYLRILQGHDFVIECSDNFTTKYLVNDGCVQLGIPFCIAGIHNFDGQVLTVIPGQTSCYRCVFPEPPPPALIPDASESGLFGTVPGITGTIQATEAIKYLLGLPGLLTNQLLLLSLDILEFEKVTLQRNPQCSVCSLDYSSPDFSDQIIHSVEEGKESKEQDKELGISLPADIPKKKIKNLKQIPVSTSDPIIDLQKRSSPMDFVYVKINLEDLAPNKIMVLKTESETQIARLIRFIKKQKLAEPLGIYDLNNRLWFAVLKKTTSTQKN